MPNAEVLLQKIQALPPERIAEIEDFVEFIAAREQERALIRASAAPNVPTLPPVANKPEYYAYDVF